MDAENSLQMLVTTLQSVVWKYENFIFGSTKLIYMTHNIQYLRHREYNPFSL
jgi:hypothetical protein